ncbi:TRAP-type C4-dicarboxylate transport system, substrate-binding protein [Alteribacillus persepolensis]|uniref:TRAP-type C4-dicarboxylate transport system, substrate-binding protein n=1 Tax=Alteribacillus persepolensis TaxID=568899 RepID=A0A1G8F896_9BACI|nr:TRAP transporter substrate-binding protein [Alteribacillus persepolensis]SDH78373.1 TRAP-type C4-dicarboxylate transport system, substrate-binding protein [Alteribacillus persepolensis]
MKKILLLTFFILILAACSENTTDTEAGQEETITLSYAFFAPESTFPAVQMKEWKERLEERTEGKVEVELFPGGTLLEANNTFEGVENGTADIGLTTTAYEPGRFPMLSMSYFSSDFTDAELASKVIADLTQEYPPETLEDFKIITTFATEPSFIQSTEPITSLDDINGKQLRVGGEMIPVLEALGASPVGMTQAEVPEALQTGVVDGTVSSREVLKDTKLAEMVGYTTDYPLGVYTFFAVMSKDKWENLPEDVQNVIDELNSEMTEFTGQYLDQHVQDAVEWSEDNHNHEIVELTDSEKEVWDKQLQEVQQNHIEELNSEGYPADEYYEKMQNLIEKYSNE